MSPAVAVRPGPAAVLEPGLRLLNGSIGRLHRAAPALAPAPRVWWPWKGLGITLSHVAPEGPGQPCALHMSPRARLLLGRLPPHLPAPPHLQPRLTPPGASRSPAPLTVTSRPTVRGPAALALCPVLGGQGRDERRGQNQPALECCSPRTLRPVLAQVATRVSPEPSVALHRGWRCRAAGQAEPETGLRAGGRARPAPAGPSSCWGLWPGAPPGPSSAPTLWDARGPGGFPLAQS